jgi:hypothetical protein
MVVGAEDPWRLTRAERVRFSWALYERWRIFVGGDGTKSNAAGDRPSGE